MRVNEFLDSINDNVFTIDGLTGKDVNPLFTNRRIIRKANFVLNRYASITKGIGDVYSFSLNTDTPFIEAPSLALRSEAYFGILVYSQGTIFLADMRGIPEVYNTFRVTPIEGITNWLMPWQAGAKKYLSFFPMRNSSAYTTNLSSDISDTDTTIPVNSASSFTQNHGRFTLGSEKILYTYRSSTQFTGCVRGSEMTTPVSHKTGELVSENNMLLFYSRLPEKIVVHDDDFIPEAVKNRTLEICEEHLEGIIKLICYELLIKVDPERAAIYKIDGDELFKQYQLDIRRGWYRGRQGTGLRDPFGQSESGTPYGANILY